jgi:hypothetical protein
LQLGIIYSGCALGPDRGGCKQGQTRNPQNLQLSHLYLSSFIGRLRGDDSKRTSKQKCSSGEGTYILKIAHSVPGTRGPFSHFPVLPTCRSLGTVTVMPLQRAVDNRVNTAKTGVGIARAAKGEEREKNGMLIRASGGDFP